MPAKRDNAGKPPLDKVLLFDLEWLAVHMEAGEAKYPDDEETGLPNWVKGGKPDSEYLGAITRHTAALKRGEDYDPETGTAHAAAIAWNALALLTCNRKGHPYRNTPTPAEDAAEPNGGGPWRLATADDDTRTTRSLHGYQADLACTAEPNCSSLYVGAFPVLLRDSVVWDGSAFCYHHLREEGLIS